jgi:hypothetical protein
MGTIAFPLFVSDSAAKRERPLRCDSPGFGEAGLKTGIAWVEFCRWELNAMGDRRIPG